jgi:hypothetical protein
MRRFVQLAMLLVFAAPGVLLLGPLTAAEASTTKAAKPGVLQSAWFWQTAYEQSNPPVAVGPLPATEPSGVPKHDLAVATTSNDGSSSKMTVLAFGVRALKPGTTIDDFTVSLTVDNSSGAANVGTGAAPVVACLPTRLWSAAAGGDYTDEPPVDCTSKVAARVKGNTYSFSIPVIAQDWVDDQNVGVAFVNDPANTTPFQTVFSGKSVKATMRYTPPAIATKGTGTGKTGGLPTTGNTGGSTTGTTGSTGSVGSPPSGPISLPPSGPTTTTTGSGTGQAPQVAADTGSPAASAAAIRAHVAPSSPNAAFWIGAVALALLIVTAGVVLADSAVPVPTATTSRLGRVLRERERQRAQIRQLTPTFGEPR